MDPQQIPRSTNKEFPAHLWDCFILFPLSCALHTHVHRCVHMLAQADRRGRALRPGGHLQPGAARASPSVQAVPAAVAGAQPPVIELVVVPQQPAQDEQELVEADLVVLVLVCSPEQLRQVVGLLPTLRRGRGSIACPGPSPTAPQPMAVPPPPCRTQPLPQAEARTPYGAESAPRGRWGRRLCQPDLGLCGQPVQPGHHWPAARPVAEQCGVAWCLLTHLSTIGGCLSLSSQLPWELPSSDSPAQRLRDGRLCPRLHTGSSPGHSPPAPNVCISSTIAGPPRHGIRCLHAVASAQELFMTPSLCHLQKVQNEGKDKVVGLGCPVRPRSGGLEG